MYEKICKIYEHLFSKVSGYGMYIFRPSKKQKAMMEKFISSIPSSNIGDAWIFDYFVFQFSRYADKKTRFEGVIHLNWLIGKKALEKWKSRSDQEMYYANEFRVKYNIRNPLVKKIEMSINKDTLRVNSNLTECIELSLYDARNKVCMSCCNKNTCKSIV